MNSSDRLRARGTSRREKKNRTDLLRLNISPSENEVNQLDTNRLGTYYYTNTTTRKKNNTYRDPARIPGRFTIFRRYSRSTV